MSKYICLDIGGTSIKHGVLNDDLELITSGNTDTEAFLGGEAVLGKAIGIVKSYNEDCNPAGICVSTAGMVDVEKGSIFHCGPTMPNYTGTPIKARMEEAFSLPCEVENDVNCAGLAEAHFGAARGSKICLCLTVGTGIGGSLILDGSVYNGISGSACEIGYMHMHGSSFEELASASAVLQRAEKRKGITLDGKELFRLAREGDAVCIEEIEGMVKYLAEGIANIIYVSNPETVVLGGGIMNEGDYLKPLLMAKLEERLVPAVFRSFRLEFARFGNNAGMIGAYYHFRQMVGRRGKA